ncbi:HU family DNA-binding protein [Mycoplasma marinum]|uniref:DNA-binding protein n=1 Tax=Mycoplasma marinum TaxID=1937190 RepID=A0A4R0XSB8_9MOLU|nr:HU family DNA-binding protein [Mycoplasma marinum]TCG11768.1 hypothetical protein C4B24_01290 [Mycoplasma marinum]
MINKKDIASKIAKNLECKQSYVAEIIDELLKITIEELKSGKKVNLNKIGVLEIVSKPAKQCYNPHKKTIIDIPERSILDFRPAKHIKDTI